MSNDTPIGYNDRFDRKDNWKKILFRPGVPVQSAELNEIQTLLNSEFRQIGQTVFKEGGILSGMDINVDLETNKVTISGGQLYALGYIHDVDEATIDITGVGDEVIGIKFSSRVITEQDDNNLKDITVGSEAYGYAGAHRLVYDYVFTVDDENSIRIAVLRDGRIDQTFIQLRPGFDDILELLAERTFDESGSYTVNKFKLLLSDYGKEDEGYREKINVKVEGGRAYVKGWKVENEVINLPITRSTETNPRIDEPELFKVDNLVYRMDNTPIRTVDTITAIVRTPSIPFYRGFTVSGKDEIATDYQPTASIYSISDALNGVYEDGVDYFLNGNYIDWSTAGSEPPTGGTYYVTLDYVKELVKGKRVLTPIAEETKVIAGETHQLDNYDIDNLVSVKYGEEEQFEDIDYTINKQTGLIRWVGGPADGSLITYVYAYWEHVVEGHFISRDSFYDQDDNILFDFFRPTGYNYTTQSGLVVNLLNEICYDTSLALLPVEDSLVYYDYKYVISRIDVLVVDYRGWFKIVEGISAINPVVPPISPSQMMIAKLFVDAETWADSVYYELNDNKRMTMSDLRLMLKEIKDIQYNDAVFQVYQDAEDIVLPTEKRGIFADNFSTFDGSDTGNIEFSSTIDVLARTATLGQERFEKPVSFEESDMIGDTDNKYIMLDFTETDLIVQPYATSTIQVNPYTFVNLGAGVSISPRVDNFTGDLPVIVNTSTQSVELNSEVIRNEVFLAFHAKGKEIGDEWENSTGGTNRLVPRDEWGAVARSSVNVEKVVSNELVTSTSKEVLDQVLVTVSPIAREIDIQVTGWDFIPNEDDISCLFNNVIIPLSASGTTESGTKSGTIKADGQGRFTGTFRVPPNTTTGDSEITIKSSSGSAGSRAETTFHSAGVDSQVIQNVTWTNTRRQVTVIENVQAVDPIAQTFSVSSDCFISSIDVYFAEVPEDLNVLVDIIIVHVENGIPTQTILSQKELYSQDCLSSRDASRATKFVFNHPAYCKTGKEYAFIIRTDSSQYSTFISVVGEFDEVNGWVNKNPNAGVLLTSSNMKTWSAEQNSDIKFTMRKAKFSTEQKIININPIIFDELEQIGRFELGSVFSEPNESTTAQWQYSVEEGIWINFNPPIEVEFNKLISKVDLRVLLSGNENTTPVIHNSVSFVGYRWKTDGQYIHRQFELHERDGRYVNVYFNANIPENCLITPKIRVDTETEWIDLIEEVTDRRNLGEGWYEYHYTWESLDDSDFKLQFQTKVEMSSPNQYTTPKISKYKVIVTTI